MTPPVALLLSPAPPVGGMVAKGGGEQTRFGRYPDIQPSNRAFTTQLRREKLTPGYLGDSYPTCGSVRFTVLCPDEPRHFVREHKHRCHRPGCPVCWPSWAGRVARKTGERIDGYAYKHAPRHIVLSPPPDAIPYEDGNDKTMQWLFDMGREICKNAGIPAAAAIAHPYRINPRSNDAITQLAARSGQNRYVYAMHQDNWRDLVYFSPHLHLIVYGTFPSSAELERKTGWTYKNFDAKGPGRTGDRLKKTLFYLLTHAWVRDNKTPVRYWFGLSSRRLGCTQIVDKVPVLCPVQTCLKPLVLIPVSSDYQDLHNASKYYRKILRYEFWVKQKRRVHHET